MSEKIKRFFGLATSQELMSAKYDYLRSLERLRDVVENKKQTDAKPSETKRTVFFN